MAIKNLNITDKLILAYSIFALMSAYFVEYILHIEPCPLCLYQRIPYFLLILLPFTKFVNHLRNYTLLFYLIIFILSALLALYHVFVEYGLIEDPVGCVVQDAKNVITNEEIRRQLMSSSVSCKHVNFSILGFSLAEINLIISMLISVYLVRITFFKKNHSI